MRPVRPQDNAALFRIIREVVLEHEIYESDYLSEESRELFDLYSLFQSPASAYWVIEDEGGAVTGGGGYARLPGTPPEAGICEVQKMYFSPACRGHGHGKALLERIIAAARAESYRVLYLETHPKLTRAIAMYEHCGFTPCVRKGHTGHDSCTVFMEMVL